MRTEDNPQYSEPDTENIQMTLKGNKKDTGQRRSKGRSALKNGLYENHCQSSIF